MSSASSSCVAPRLRPRRRPVTASSASRSCVAPRLRASPSGPAFGPRLRASAFGAPSAPLASSKLARLLPSSISSDRDRACQRQASSNSNVFVSLSLFAHFASHLACSGYGPRPRTSPPSCSRSYLAQSSTSSSCAHIAFGLRLEASPRASPSGLVFGHRLRDRRLLLLGIKLFVHFSLQLSSLFRLRTSCSRSPSAPTSSRLSQAI